MIIVSGFKVWPNEVEEIYGDNSKAKNILGWKYDMSFFDVLDILIEEEKNSKVIRSFK